MEVDELGIGALATRTGTKVTTIRYYEQIGLLQEPPRSTGQQRRYEARDLQRLAFIRHSRELGFPLDAIRELLQIVDKPDQSCERVDRVAKGVLADVEAKIERLESLRAELRRMIRQCRRDRVADCRIIEVLAHQDHMHCLDPTHRAIKAHPKRKEKSRL